MASGPPVPRGPAVQGALRGRSASGAKSGAPLTFACRRTYANVTCTPAPLHPLASAAEVRQRSRSARGAAKKSQRGAATMSLRPVWGTSGADLLRFPRLDVHLYNCAVHPREFQNSKKYKIPLFQETQISQESQNPTRPTRPDINPTTPHP